MGVGHCIAVLVGHNCSVVAFAVVVCLVLAYIVALVVHIAALEGHKLAFAVLVVHSLA